MPHRTGRTSSNDAKPAVLSASQLNLSYGTAHVLRDVVMRVYPGQVLAVMGPSGSGKSSLLHCFAGLIDFDSGCVTVDGRELSNMTARARNRHRLHNVGFVRQFGDLVPELTLRENVELPLRLMRRPRARVREESERLMQELAIADVADRRVSEVSGGQMQRAAVCRALIHRPALILADEPTGSLDSVAGDLVVAALVTQARRQDTGIVLVTHEARIAAHADELITLRDGRVTSPREGAEL